jgi:hypothetical protein
LCFTCLFLQVVTVPTASPDAPIDDVAAGKGCVPMQQQQQFATGVQAGNRTVLAKPLHPNQTLPPSIRTNLVSMGNPPITCKP